MAGWRATVFSIACGWLGAGAAAAEPPQVPDVVPGIPNRFPVVKVFSGPPLAVWLDGRPGCRQLLAGPLVDRGPRAVLDTGPDCLLQSAAPEDLVVAVTALRTADLYVVEAGHRPPSPTELRRYYLVRRGGKRTELVCRFAEGGGQGGLQLTPLTRSPFTFDITGRKGERLRYRLDKTGVCRPSLPAGAPSDFVYENAFAHAQMLHGLELWADAGDAHALVLHMREKGAHSEAAARAAIDARSNYLDMQCFPAEGHLEPQKIEGPLAKRISSCDDYVRLFPASELAPKMTLRKANDLYGCNHLEEAAVLFQSVASRRPTDDLARQAQEMYRHVQADIERRDAKRRGSRIHLDR